MNRGFSVPLLSRDELADDGLGGRALHRAIDAGEIVRLRAGVHVRGTDLTALSPEERMVLHARAVQLGSLSPPVFCHATAAAIHGDPLHGVDASRVHVVATSDRSGAGAGVTRHDGAVPDGELVEIGGLLLTSPARTLADVARATRYETAVCVADAELRRVGGAGVGVYDADAGDALRAEAAEILHRFVHGVRRGERVLAFADGRAQLPGESVSRIRLAQLGFAPPRLQVRVPAPGGGSYWVDFGLDDADALGEFDGKAKYRDELLRGGRTPDEVFDMEKRREDWIRGLTQKRFGRWEWLHLATAMTLGDRLAAFGIVPPRVPRLR